MTPPIAILGAGPAGLALARLLELADVDYIVFERDESSVSRIKQGGCLDLHAGSGLLAIEEAGLLERFKSVARYDASTTVANAQGQVMAKLDPDEGDAARPEIDRKDLRALLLDTIPKHRVRWGSRVQGVKKSNEDEVSIQFDDGSVESGFRLVVGADGAWSKARSLLISANPHYSGLHYLTTRIEPDNPFHATIACLASRGNYFCVGEEKMLSVQSMGDDSYALHVGLALPEDFSTKHADLLAEPAKLREWLVRDHFANWAEVHKQMIAESDGGFRPWAMYGMPVDKLKWDHVPGITLIGDAAHVCPPSGEGVNYAMLDSVQLARQIAKYGVDDLDRAVKEYEQSMFPRAIELITESEKLGGLLFAPDAPKGLMEAWQGMGGELNGA